MLINLKLTLNENTCDTELCILSECNGNQTYIQLVPKETLNHLAKLARWFSCVVSTYLYGAFDCMYL